MADLKVFQRTLATRSYIITWPFAHLLPELDLRHPLLLVGAFVFQLPPYVSFMSSNDLWNVSEELL